MKAETIPRMRFAIGVVLAVAILLWSADGAQLNLSDLTAGSGNIWDFLSRLFPPDFSEFPLIIGLLVETLQIAIIGTAIGALLSLAIAMGAAENIAPWWIYHPARTVMNIIRSVPDLVFALVFVSAVGLGPFAGVLTMTVGSVGSIGKVFAEAMESVDEEPVNALKAVGASSPQVVHYGILPQALPALVSYTLLLFESNIRSATILGLVGAGGIGLELTLAISRYEYGHLCAMIICIVVLVAVIDQFSAAIRKKVH